MASCKYWDCGWCYAPDDVKTNASSQSACLDYDYCPYLKSQMTEIEKTEGEIKVLQAKLELLKEIEKHKSPCEEAFKRVYGYYPEVCERSVWIAFQKAYEQAQKDYKVGVDEPSMTNCVLLGNPPDGYVAWNEWYNEMGSKGILHNLKISSKDYQPTPQERGERLHKDVERCVRESVKWCEENPDKDPLDWLKPQTPEQVADGLKEAFREAVKQGVVSSTTKRQTLRDVCQDWWDDDGADTYCIDDLVDRIENWFPTEHDDNSYKWNECIRRIREKLR